MFRACVLFVVLVGARIAAADGPVIVESYTSHQPVRYHYQTSNATAQGVAELQARCGQCRHFGGNSGYEGVGSGPSPDAALGNCCFSRSGMRVVDQGVARSSNGRWFACKRYR